MTPHSIIILIKEWCIMCAPYVLKFSTKRLHTPSNVKSDKILLGFTDFPFFFFF